MARGVDLWMWRGRNNRRRAEFIPTTDGGEKGELFISEIPLPPEFDETSLLAVHFTYGKPVESVKLVTREKAIKYAYVWNMANALDGLPIMDVHEDFGILAESDEARKTYHILGVLGFLSERQGPDGMHESTLRDWLGGDRPDESTSALLEELAIRGLVTALGDGFFRVSGKGEAYLSRAWLGHSL